MLDKVKCDGIMADREGCADILGSSLEEATMAENESLNLGRARRWQPVLQALAAGADMAEILKLVRRCLYQTLRAVRKQVPFDDLLKAACNSPDDLPALIRDCQIARDYARLFQQVACPGASRKDVLVAYQLAFCTSFLDQIRGRVVCSRTAGESAVEIRERLENVLEALGPDFHRIALNLAARPEWKIIMPRGNRPQSRTEQARELLGQSLLAGSLP